ncbi:hypothetical protein DH2020_034611 [Rehmannia glutinosa]|uniref:Transposase Tnp1/En/Spm-like domain-containing protein n=1 Tax=Rehmannia glutinosa TaxID=99300 RepID=A0ABR0V8R1_REHGL
MPKIWGQQSDEVTPISFNDLGQPNDEKNASTLAHFLGSIARNGRFCPLHYKDWRLMPYSYKDEMLKIVKAKFSIPTGNETYILKSINKKWRSWKSFVKASKFDPNVPMEQQLSSKPDRVEDEQYKALIEHWMSDKSKAISEKNRKTRTQLELLHRMGKKSYALVREAWKKKYGNYPTKADLFKECYYRADDPRISAVIHEAIEQMEQLEEHEQGEHELESSNEADCIHKSNDKFEKVMGKDKNGHVRMYGLGVSRSDIHGPLPSRDASYRLAMEYKEKYDAAIEYKKKYDALSAKVHGGAQVVENCDHQNVPISSSNNRRSSTSTSRSKNIRVHSRVVLKSLENINEIVASGYVSSMNSIRVNGEELGSGWCEITVQYQMRNDVHLIKPYDHIQTIGDSLGAPVAWPLSLVFAN